MGPRPDQPRAALSHRQNLLLHLSPTRQAILHPAIPRSNVRNSHSFRHSKDSSQSPANESNGLADDSDYLDPWLRLVLSPFLVSPDGINRIQTAAEFKRQLCLTLLAAAKLEIISIWSPSFLTVHLDYIQSHRHELIQALRDRISPQRRQLLLQDPIPWTQLWPDLKLISCWDSASSADSANRLRLLFPNVLVQGKGLLATEAPITIPSIPAQGFLPLLSDIFFEFADDAGTIYLLHELQPGQSYTLILSQLGGLYRYRIGDRVRVTHFYKKTPCLEFIGRDRTISDLVGEKLSITFVQDVLATLPIQTASFTTLTPVMPSASSTPETATPHYALLLDQAEASASAIAAQLDQALCQSPHYAHARLLGQLDPATVLIAPAIPDQLTQQKTQVGQTWGDIKHPLLRTNVLEGWKYAELVHLTQTKLPLS